MPGRPSTCLRSALAKPEPGDYTPRKMKASKEHPMPIPPESHHEQPSAYFVQDRSNAEELHRLQTQDSLVTASMGGFLPDRPDLTPFRSVLDFRCVPRALPIALAT